MAAVTGEQLRAMVQSALTSLREHRDQIDSLNVFPVPDGDTGTNMYFTMLMGYEEIESHHGTDPVDMFAVLSRGTLMGSKGNSGVILSQIMEGINEEVAGHGRVDTEAFRAGLAHGAELAYESVVKPEEGTILTVVRETAEGLQKKIKGEALLNFWERAVELGRAALMKTPELLPVLGEAGVVDAGGAGLVAMWEGFCGGLGGSRVWDWGFASTTPSSDVGTGMGYHMQFLMECGEEEAREVCDLLEPLGDSIIVAGKGDSYRVHVHTERTEEVLERVESLGRVAQVEIDELGRVPMLLGGGRVEQVGSGVRVAVLAFAQGRGLIRQFEDMGAKVLVGGPGARPSTKEIIGALLDMQGGETIILPNDLDSLPAARAALNEVDKRARILPTPSPVSGLAAMEAYLEGGDPERVFLEMEEAVSRVAWGNITRAGRASRIGGHEVEPGDWLGFDRGDLVAVGKDARAVARDLVRSLKGEEAHLVTMLWGEGLDHGDMAAITDAVKKDFPSLGVETLEGGQPFHSLVVGVE